ncbi:MAG: hypothetical protein JXR10_12360 [Cyclobacteriaceae bacterium]
MNNTHNNIRRDAHSLVLTLTYGENLQALACAEKIKKNLEKHIADGKTEYKHNLAVVNQVIAEHQERLAELSSPSMLSNAS